MPETALAAEESRPSADMEAVRILTMAFVKTIGRRKAVRFTQELAGLIAQEESVRVLMPRRSREEGHAQAEAQREAAGMLRRMLPVILASIPPT